MRTQINIAIKVGCQKSMKEDLCGGLLINTKSEAHRQYKCWQVDQLAGKENEGSRDLKKIGKSSEQEQKKYGWNSKFSAGVDLECSCNVSEGKGELTG